MYLKGDTFYPYLHACKIVLILLSHDLGIICIWGLSNILIYMTETGYPRRPDNYVVSCLYSKTHI